jgi:plasmid maintenance system antidote protein VapI
MSRRRERKAEESLIKWRRKQVAELWFAGKDVNTMAEILKVSSRTIYEDREYIEAHSDEWMRDYVIRTVTFIINRSLYQLDIANQEAMKILTKDDSGAKDKLAASLVVAKTAKDVVDIVTNNKSIIDTALKLEANKERQAEEYLKDNNNYELSQQSDNTATDPNRVF